MGRGQSRTTLTPKTRRDRMSGMSAQQTLPSEIAAQSQTLAQLCQRYGVRRLELFGSATGARFDPARSDLLVEFGAPGRLTPFEQYFGFKESVEALFGRPVDLVLDGAPRNPWFLSALNASRRLLYAA